MTTTFASFVKKKRMGAGLTLRNFCKKATMDPSNWSKIERGVKKPPHSREILENISLVLGIEKDSEDFNTLIELAALSAVPKGLIEEDILNQLPVFFRTVRGTSSSENELKKLVSKIREAWTPEN